MPITPKPGVTNISVMSSRHPIIIKIMLKMDIEKPDPTSQIQRPETDGRRGSDGKSRHAGIGQTVRLQTQTIE